MELSNVIKPGPVKLEISKVTANNLSGEAQVDSANNESSVVEPVEKLSSAVEPKKISDGENIDKVLESTKRVREAVQDANRTFPNRVKFHVDDQSGQIVVRVIDKNTEEVVRQIPPEEFLQIADKLKILNHPPKGVVLDQTS